MGAEHFRKSWVEFSSYYNNLIELGYAIRNDESRVHGIKLGDHISPVEWDSTITGDYVWKKGTKNHIGLLPSEIRLRIKQQGTMAEKKGTKKNPAYFKGSFLKYLGARKIAAEDGDYLSHWGKWDTAGIR